MISKTPNSVSRSILKRYVFKLRRKYCHMTSYDIS